MYQCFKALYFPQTEFLDASNSSNNSYVWKSIMSTKPILTDGCCWRGGDGDKWIPNYPTNIVIFPPSEVEWEWRVADLIDPDLKWWWRDYINSVFHKEDAESILRISLSHRQCSDTIVWLHHRKRVCSVKTGYYVAKWVMQLENRVESSSGPIEGQLW